MTSSKTTSPVRKRSVAINGRKTSVRLEEAFWTGLKEIAALQGVALADLASQVDRERNAGNLSSALRLHVLAYYKNLEDDAFKTGS